jgi:tetratricopeptide (TPR) repeat protein
LAQVNLANIYLCKGEYDAALVEYHSAMKMLETTLPSDHPDRARSVHNIGLAYERQGDLEKATEYFDQAASIAERTLSAEHPLMNLIKKSRERISNAVETCIIVRL